MNRTVSQKFEGVESPRTAASLSVAGGRRAFFRGLASLETIQELLALAKDRACAALVLRRVLGLSIQAVDQRYENPFDVALCAYLWILEATHPDLARVGAQAVQGAPNCWWAEDVSRDILHGGSLRTLQSESGRIEVAPVETPLAEAAVTVLLRPGPGDVGELLLTGTLPQPGSVIILGRARMSSDRGEPVSSVAAAPVPPVPVYLLTSDSRNVASEWNGR